MGRRGHRQPSCRFVVNAAACSHEQDAGVRGSEDTLFVACSLHDGVCKRDSSGIGRSAPPEEVDAGVAGVHGDAPCQRHCHQSAGVGPRATRQEARSGGDDDAEPGAPLLKFV